MNQKQRINLLEEALALHQALQHDEAERIFREVLTVDAYHPVAQYHLGFLVLNEHRWEDAVDHLECALVSDR
jgi:tetratricopeptide (TPR) repeat protein